MDTYTDVYPGGPLDDYTDVYPGITPPSVVTLPVLPSVRSSAATSHASGTLGVTAETVKRPLLVEAGDLLVLYAVMDAGVVADLVPPSGFTELGKLGTGTNNPVGLVAYKVAGGSEPATYTYGRFSASSDGASLMVAVRDWDGNPANIRFVQQETTRTARAVPTVTPATDRGLVLTSAHHDATAATTWGWVAPGQGLIAGVSHNAAGWSSVGVASQPHTKPAAVAGLTWADSRVPSTVAPMVTTAVTVGAGPATVEARVGPATGGTGGPQTDRTNVSFSDGTKTSTYHCYAAGLDWTKPVGLIVYGDGSAEFGLANPTSAYLLAGANGLVAVAKRHNMILLTPRAPGNGCNDGDGVCWYDASGDGTTAAQKTAWSQALITHILGQYDIDRSRIVAGGYSSGAQWVTRFWGPAHAHTVIADGAIVPISYGGAPAVTNNNTADFRADVAMHWNTGETDSATTTSSWGSLGGHNHYQNAGYQTTVTVVGGTGHSRYVSSPSEGEFGRIVNDVIVRHVRPAVTVDVPEAHTRLAQMDGAGSVTGSGTATSTPTVALSGTGSMIIGHGSGSITATPTSDGDLLDIWGAGVTVDPDNDDLLILSGDSLAVDPENSDLLVVTPGIGGSGSGHPGIVGSVTLTADGALVGSGQTSQEGAGTATLTAAGTVTATAATSAAAGTGVLAGGGVLAGVAVLAATGSATFTGAGTLAGSGVGEAWNIGTGTLSGTGTVTAAGVAHIPTVPPRIGRPGPAYTIDGVPLDDPGGRWWVSDRTGETSAPALVLHTLNIMAGQVGEIDAPSPAYGAAVWPLIMGIRGGDYAQAKAFKDELDRFLLGRHSPVTVIEDGPDLSKMCRGIVAEGTEVERFDSGFRLDVAYPVRIPAGRWFDVNEQAVTCGPGNRVAGDTQDGTYLLAPLLGGSRDMDPTIVTIGNGSNTDVRVTDVASGQWVRIAGNIILGTPIVIDPLNLTATAGGTPASGLLDFSARDMYLSPTATVRVQQNGTQPVTIRARRAYT